MTTAQALPGHTVDEWARDVLAGLGVPVSPVNLDTLKRWAAVESGGYNPNVRGGLFNPLNTTEGAKGYCGNGGSQGNIKDFCSYEQGVAAIVHNLLHAGRAGGGDDFGYGRIIDALKRSDQAATFAAIDNSAFGTHFTSGGALPAPAEGGTPARPINGTPSGGTVDSPITDPDSECVWKLPSVSAGPLDLGGGCIMNRAQGRAVLGAAALFAGAAIMLAGLVMVGVSTKAGRQVVGLATGGKSG